MNRLVPRTPLAYGATAIVVVALFLAAISGAACTNASVGATATQAITDSSTIFVSSSTSSSSSTSNASSTSASATLASTTTVPVVETTEPGPRAPLAFDTALTMEHIKKLASDIGIRPGGSAAENEAVAYAWDYLAQVGYRPVITEVPLPNGKMSHNVTVAKEGASPLSVVIGGHLDTKNTTPGANDDASGAAAVLELARDFADADLSYTLVFVLFGNEEILDANKNHHHYGSRNFVANLTADEKSNLSAMISLDMIAYGDTFNVRTMGKGPQTLRDMLLASSDASDAGLVYLKDTGPSGWSDHEPFELAGYPAVWFQWLEDPTYHGRGDTYEHCDAQVVRRTGEFLHAFLADLGPKDLEMLHESVRR